MLYRQIDAMHSMFGFGNGQCKDCSRFHRVQRGNKTVFKCDAYSMSHSAASDWRAGNDACGLKNKPWDGNQILDIIKNSGKKKDDLQIPGQLSLWEGGTY